jgi:ATP-dependent DNA helicase RecG
MSSATAAGERALNLRRVAAGEVDVVVGTHALIEEDVDFRNLALLVIDEQHRFGVRQRLALREKAARRPDVLIMTATPIPRTLALTCFGDMDVSIIDEMPPGRQPIETRVLPPAQWERAFEAALAELRRGRRVFVIYPLVEESEGLDITSATEGYRELTAGVFRDFQCCLLHGQMRHESKREAMEGFRTGRYRVMVATTVVEVGIDVPEATVMIVQHAERLGLAQLHQLRGRIGRGRDRGMCFLLAEPTTEEARRRLEVLAGTTDGFKIAEADLSIRGPGEVFGTQQSGAPEFRCYDFSDTRLLDEARKDAFALIESDPTLSRPEHGLLRDTVRRQYGKRFMLGGVG